MDDLWLSEQRRRWEARNAYLRTVPDMTNFSFRQPKPPEPPEDKRTLADAFTRRVERTPEQQRDYDRAKALHEIEQALAAEERAAADAAQLARDQASATYRRTAISRLLPERSIKHG